MGTDARYGYDDWGNLRSRSRVSGPASFPDTQWDYSVPGDTRTPHAPKRLSTGGAVESYAYDAAGHVTTGRGNTFT